MAIEKRKKKERSTLETKTERRGGGEWVRKKKKKLFKQVNRNQNVFVTCTSLNGQVPDFVG